MGKRGPKKKYDEDVDWAPVIKRYKPAEYVEINAFAKRSQERVLEGFKQLFKTVHRRDPSPEDMKYIHKVIKGIDF